MAALRRPRYSSGCAACRRMKVKCDEAKPHCGRCVRAGRDCPGSLDNGEKIFVHMNETVATKVQLRESKKKEQRSLDSPSVDSSSTSSEESLPNALVVTRPSTNWKTNSVVHFLDNYVSNVNNLGHGYLEFLPAYCAKHRSCDYLTDALAATAMANLANISNVSSLQKESLGLYGRALRSMSTALNDPATLKTSHLVVAVNLLQKYQTFMGPSGDVSTFEYVDPHEQFLAKIMQLRLSDPEAEPLDPCLARSIHYRTQIRELDGCSPQVVRDYTDINNLSIHAIENQLWRLLYDTSQVTGAVEQLMLQVDAGHTIIDDEIDLMIEQGMNMRKTLLAWDVSTPKEWRYDICPRSAHSQDYQFKFPKYFITFRDQNHAGIFMGWWLARIHLAQRTMQCIDYLLPRTTQNSGLTTIRDVLQEDIRSIVNLICSSGPFLLGDIDDKGDKSKGAGPKNLASYYMARGLHVANWMPGIWGEQRRWILDTLYRIGHSKGIHHAAKSREDWLEAHPEYDRSQLQYQSRFLT